MPTATINFRRVIVFVLDLECIFAESYVKLQDFVIILTRVTLQCSVSPRQVKSIVLIYTVQP